MAEPLKLIYTETFLQTFAAQLQSVYPLFESRRFVDEVMGEGWEILELKARIRRISSVLGRFLPLPFAEALDILYRIDEACTGFPYLFFPDFVEVYGTSEDDFELALDALERFTSRSSSEFAIRFFLLREPERTLQRMHLWACSDSEHVRRLASEGCRPRLPWGQALPVFKRNPDPVLELLETLKADPSLYVRKSVANNLNDIAKDHPDRIKETALRWYGSDPRTDWIVRHGCRGLLRAADPAVLSLFGYTAAGSEEAVPLIETASISVSPDSIAVGGSVELRIEGQMRLGGPYRIRLEYAIDFVKASGRTSRKLFRLSDKTIAGGERFSIVRRHRFADLTTRRHYPGVHRISLIVNGAEYAQTSLTLHAPSPVSDS
ncbi:DNA alkylation repair protein [Saccharibacillus qingshengii]|uniref:DNA alkylation repair protein n=1 Tax=Saccharibacillus qingshengii TaxID=1763540 RepID=UPI0015540C94|nr:DNA alkylation repair protein [Saccharibacillus qingshengii]